MSKYVYSKNTRTKKPYSKFKAWMDENNVTQARVAEVIGKTRSNFNQNLNGTAGDFSISDVRKICLEFNISSDAFFINQEVSMT